MAQTTLIIGKQGKTGSRVEALLKRIGREVRAVSRSSSTSFDWNNSDNWLEVMQGCDSAYITYQPDLAVPQAKAAIANFVSKAKQAGIKHLVLLSGRGEEGAQACEQLVINSGLSWNIVRASWFAQNFSEGFLIEGILQRRVCLPAADVLEPFVDVDDIAEVAVACLTKADLHEQVFEVTGPQLLTFKDCIDIIAQELNSSIEFVPISVAQFIEALEQQHLPQEMLWLMQELFGNVLDGRNSQTTDGVEQALGRPATAFRDYVKKTMASQVWEIK